MILVIEVVLLPNAGMKWCEMATKGISYFSFSVWTTWSLSTYLSIKYLDLL